MKLITLALVALLVGCGGSSKPTDGGKQFILQGSRIRITCKQYVVGYCGYYLGECDTGSNYHCVTNLEEVP